jgi:hypothetical protein
MAAMPSTPDSARPTLDPPDQFEMGVISYSDEIGGHDLDAKVILRGNTSLKSLDFPKIKVKVQSETSGTLFKSSKSFKVGTHGGDSGEIESSRLHHEDATWREAFIYQALEILEITSLDTVVARIKYRDSDEGWSIERKAFLIEDIDKLAERLGGEELESLDMLHGRVEGHLDQQAALNTEFGYILASSYDWELLKESRPEGRNIKVIRLADGTDISLPSDFDSSTWVTGKVPKILARQGNKGKDRKVPEKGFRGKEPLYRWMAFEMQRVGGDYPKSMVKATVERLKAKRSLLEARLATAPLDEKGRKQIAKQIKTFFETIEPGVMYDD